MSKILAFVENILLKNRNTACERISIYDNNKF